jgi:hypothetical protein
MAVQVGSACYGSPLEAAQATASAQLGRIVESGSGLYSVDVVSATASTIEYGFTPLDGAAAIPTAVVPFTAQPCNLLQFEDGIELGWYVIAAWALTWGVRFLARQFKG